MLASMFMIRAIVNIALLLCLIFMASYASAGNQQEEALSLSVQAMMQESVRDLAAPKLIGNKEENQEIGRAHV